MKRRDLLKYLLATPLATFIDYEKLLWVPDKTIVVVDKPSKIICVSNPSTKDYDWLRDYIIQENTRLYLAM
jgi:hypothetical protein